MRCHASGTRPCDPRGQKANSPECPSHSFGVREINTPVLFPFQCPSKDAHPPASLTSGAKLVLNHPLCKPSRSQLTTPFGVWEFLLILFCSQLKLRQENLLLNILLCYWCHHCRVVMGFKWKKKKKACKMVSGT